MTIRVLQTVSMPSGYYVQDQILNLPAQVEADLIRRGYAVQHYTPIQPDDGVVADVEVGAYERTVQINAAQLSGALTDFVALVDLNVAGVQNRIATDGLNLSFRGVDGTQLSHVVARRAQIAYDGAAWSWFTNPRAVYNADSGTPYTFYSYNKGRAEGAGMRAGCYIARLDHNSNTVTEFQLNATIEADDHNYASIFIRPDGRIVAAYARHNVDQVMRWRVSTNPYDISAWGAEQTYTTPSGNVTYANLVYLADSGRLYNFFRRASEQWAYLVSTDFGATWSASHTDLFVRAGYQVYSIFRATAGNRIDILLTNGHPSSNSSISCFHGTLSFENGAETVRRSNGARVESTLPLQIPSSALSNDNFTPIYVFDALKGDAWVWDIARDASGRPVVLYQYKTDAGTVSKYLWARYDGGVWSSEIIADSGMDISTVDEPDYLAGMCLADYDADRLTIWLSRSPGLVDHATSGAWNLTRVKRTAASTFETEAAATDVGAVTSSGQVCVARPVVPRGQPALTKAEVLYFAGNYRDYDDYNCGIFCWPPLPVAAYVRVPSVSSLTGASFVMRFGVPGVAAGVESPSGVWAGTYFAILGELLPGRGRIPDVSGNAQHIDMVTGTYAVGRVERDSRLGSAVMTDDTTAAQLLNLPAPASGGLNLGSATAWTVLAQLRPTADVTNARAFLSSWQTTNLGANIMCRLNTDNTLAGFAWVGAGSQVGGTFGTATVTNGAWNTAAVKFNTTQLEGFINGVSAGTQATGSAMNATATEQTRVMSSDHNSNHKYDGALDEIVMFRSALATAWIKAWHDNRFNYSSLITLGPEVSVGR